MLEKEIYDLQIKISYMEDYVTKLNSVILEQNEENNRLSRELRLLSDKVGQLEERIENKDSLIADDPPPHY